MSVVDLRAETRAYGRARLRDLALDATRDVVLDRGWAAVRMGAIATMVGISRQSLHAEFGTKDELGNALVMRETSVFLEELQGLLAGHPGDLAGGVFEASQFILSASRDNPLLHKGREAVGDIKDRWEMSDSPLVHKIQARRHISLSTGIPALP